MVLQAKRTTHASTRLGQRAAVMTFGTSDTCARNYDKFCIHTGKMYSQLKLFAFVLPHFKPGARKSNRFHTAPTRDLTIQHDAHEKRQGFLFLASSVRDVSKLKVSPLSTRTRRNSDERRY